jgi:hypothetical protein
VRLLVCGGRDFGTTAPERFALRDVLDLWHQRRPITTLIHGAARGADTLAGEWAVAKAVPVDPHPVAHHEWEAWRAAGRPSPSPGSARNARMLAEGRPGAVLAFPGGTGTADMVRKARAAGVPVALVVVNEKGWEVTR